MVSVYVTCTKRERKVVGEIGGHQWFGEDVEKLRNNDNGDDLE